jgi:hypothetical protein
MAEIRGIDGMSPQEISFEINRGGKFVVYRYCFSAAFHTVTYGTDIYFIRPGESRIRKGLPCSLFTLLLGWWGIWGPIYTVRFLWTNFHGGEDVTAAVAGAMGLRDVNWDTASAGAS